MQFDKIIYKSYKSYTISLNFVKFFLTKILCFLYIVHKNNKHYKYKLPFLCIKQLKLLTNYE